MIRFVIAKKETGEIEQDCPECAIRACREEDYENYTPSKSHVKYKINTEANEDMMINEIDVNTGEYTHYVETDSEGNGVRLAKRKDMKKSRAKRKEMKILYVGKKIKLRRI